MVTVASGRAVKAFRLLAAIIDASKRISLFLPPARCTCKGGDQGQPVNVAFCALWLFSCRSSGWSERRVFE